MTTGFIPISKKAQEGEKVNVNIKLYGDNALKFKAVADAAELSLSDLGEQMIEHCLKNPGKEEKR